MRADDEALQAVGARDQVSLAYYPEFLRLHLLFQTRGSGSSGHSYDLEFLKALLPEDAYEVIEKSTTNAISSSGVITTVTAIAIQDRISLAFTDAAYVEYLVQLRSMPRENARLIARNSARAFKDLFGIIAREDFLTSLGNGPEVAAFYGDSAKTFVLERLPLFENVQLDQIGQALDTLWQHFKKYRVAQNTADHVRYDLGCKLKLKARR